MLGLQSNAFALSCSMALSSAQDRFGFTFLSSHDGRSGSIIQCMTFGMIYTPANINFVSKKFGGVTYSQANTVFVSLS